MNQSVSYPLKTVAAGTANGSSNSAGAAARSTHSAVSYVRPAASAEAVRPSLARVSFGKAHTENLAAVPSARGLCISVALEPISVSPANARSIETWHAQGNVEQSQDGAIRYAHDGHRSFALIEVDEREHGGILGAAEFAYGEARRFQQASPYRHILRMWNYADDVNEGAGDLERYRQFCIGRARGLGDSLADSYPAASAVGRQQTTGLLQVYWLADRVAGTAVENPRQVSAYRYPDIYGPVSPAFSRATIAPDGTLLISGTASILGHASHHIGDVIAQLDETLRNLDALIAQAARQRSGLQPTIASQTCLKIYVRDAAHAAGVDAHLRTRLPGVHAIYLEADICRRELLLEIECVQGLRAEGE